MTIEDSIHALREAAADKFEAPVHSPLINGYLAGFFENFLEELSSADRAEWFEKVKERIEMLQAP
jgi:hypothetical protein